MKLWNALTVTAALSAATFALAKTPLPQQPSAGRMCLAPLPTPAKGQGAPWRAVGNDNLTNYVVRVDRQKPVPLSLSAASWISGLDLEVRHSVSIRADEKVLESFDVQFDQVSFRDKSRPDLCLFVNSLYLTWQLWPVERTGEWCPCWNNERPH